MKIATFNINGVKARIGALCDWLGAATPDVVVLQEIKSVDEAFPREPLEDLGYAVETHGQKSFNGVAILSKLPLEDVQRSLPGDAEDDQARYIEAWVAADRPVRVCGLYLPNGNPVPGPKYDYKLAWMARLQQHVAEVVAAEHPAVVCGDFNVIPQREDAARPDAWSDDALFLPQSREAFRRLVHLGLTDAIRAVRPHLPPAPGPGDYTFWDYQGGAWDRNDGIRIDHLLLTAQAADRLIDAGVDSEPRGRTKPSDHAPVWAELAD